jgi:hypothetical protein
MDDFLRSWMASDRKQSPKDYLETYKKTQENKKLYKDGKATRVISGYSTSRVGPSGGSKKTPIYSYIPNQQAPAPAPAPAPAKAPAPATPAPLMPTISEASKQYRADTQARETAIDKKIADFNASEAAAVKAREIAEQARITGNRTAAANQARSNQAPNLQIQPASSTPTTAGTNAFRIRKRQGSKQKQLASSLNIGQSNTLNI